MARRDLTQSVAVSEDEQFLIRVIAAAHGMKPAAATRHLLFRGLSDLLADGELLPPRAERELLDALRKLVATDKTMKRAAAQVRRELEEKATPKRKPPVEP